MFNITANWFFQQTLNSYHPFAQGLLRLKGAYDPFSDLEEMKREKEEADKEPRIFIFSLVGLHTLKGLFFVILCEIATSHFTLYWNNPDIPPQGENRHLYGRSN